MTDQENEYLRHGYQFVDLMCIKTPVWENFLNLILLDLAKIDFNK